jgi:hypothetical protein
MGNHEERVREALSRVSDSAALEAAGWAVQISDGSTLAPRDYSDKCRMRLRHAVLMEGANVDCRAVRDGGG